MIRYSFTITMASHFISSGDKGGKIQSPPTTMSSGSADEYSDEDIGSDFAMTLASVVFGIRNAEAAWGNDRWFGGADLTETAARLVKLFADYERKPAMGSWHFSPPELAEGVDKEWPYSAKRPYLDAMVAAAERYLEVCALDHPPDGA